MLSLLSTKTVKRLSIISKKCVTTKDLYDIMKPVLKNYKEFSGRS